MRGRPVGQFMSHVSESRHGAPGGGGRVWLNGLHPTHRVIQRRDGWDTRAVLPMRGRPVGEFTSHVSESRHGAPGGGGRVWLNGLHPTHRVRLRRDGWGTRAVLPMRGRPVGEFMSHVSESRHGAPGGGGRVWLNGLHPTHRVRLRHDGWGTRAVLPERGQPVGEFTSHVSESRHWAPGGGGGVWLNGLHPTHRERLRRDGWGTRAVLPERGQPVGEFTSHVSESRHGAPERQEQTQIPFGNYKTVE